MTSIKNIFKIFAVTALLSSANAYAGDFLVDTTIDDSGDYVNGGSNYAIDSMDIKWADNGEITVDIYTNFVSRNNKGDEYGGERIVFGDLLIGTGASVNPYDYAFVLTEERDKRITKNVKSWTKDGALTEIGSTTSSQDYHDNSSDVMDQAVMGASLGDEVNQGSWSAAQLDGFDKISFSFNVSGIVAFKNASQLAFSWGMSCANDIISGVVNVDRNSIPEPATVFLMLLALGFMANNRKNA